MYPIIDWHCDVLMKLQQHPDWNFYDQEELDVNILKLKQGGIRVQAMAIFIDPKIWDKYDVALAQIEAYKTRVLTQPGIVQIRDFKDIDNLKDDEIGTFLTLEGLDCVGDDMDKVRHFLDEGVLSIGMTWNNANLACDGIGEMRGAGLTQFGLDVVSLMNERNLFIDVSHISEKGFDDVLDHAKHVIASHSNVRSIAHHRRNLNDHQILRMENHGAPVHLVYCDAFIMNEYQTRRATIDEILEHIAYYIDYGLSDNLGLGSDFDGISSKVIDLEHSGQTPNLINAIESRFGEAFAKRITSQNFMDYVHKRM